MSMKIEQLFLKIRGAPDSNFYYPAGYRIGRISEKKSGRITDILINIENMNIILTLAIKLYDIIIYFQR